MSNALELITDETIAALMKAQTAGMTVGTGLAGYELQDVVSLIPAKSVTYDRVRRVSASVGSAATHWQAFTSLNNAQPNPFTGWDGGGDVVKMNRVDLQSLFFPVRTVARYTLDSVDLARGYDDARNRAIVQGAYAWRLMDNKAILGAQRYGLPALAALPTLTTATSGGTIAATTTVYVSVQARSYYNWFFGGGSGVRQTANIATGAGSTNKVTIPSWTPVQGAAGYDIFAGPAAGTQYYVTTVTTNAAVDITSMPAANAAVPALPELYATVPTLNTTTDSSYNSNAYNGLLASIHGDYDANGAQVTPGSGVLPSGGYWKSLNGAQLAGSGSNLPDIDAVLLNFFTRTGGESPDIMVMNAQEAQTIKNRLTASGSASLYLEPQDGGRAGIVGGGAAASYINGNTGDKIQMVTEPHLPPGRILFLKESIPFPEAGTSNTFEVRTLREVSQRPLPVPRVLGANGGPAEEFDISSAETFVNRAPMLCAVLSDIAAG